MDASQEMFTLGICNVLGSCVSSMPTCGAFTRSAVSHASGVRTPFAGIYTATITMLALSLLTPYFYFIPKATLAAVLIIAVMFMVPSINEFSNVVTNEPFLRLILCFLCICGVIRNVIFGLGVGVLLCAWLLVWKLAYCSVLC